MLFHMIKSLSQGDIFLDRQTRPVPILYISEEPDTLLAERADSLDFKDTWSIGWLTPEPGMTWEKCMYYMKRWIFMYRDPAPLIIVDTISRFWSAADENNASQVNFAITPVLEIVRNSQAAFFGIHHNRKQGGGGGMGVRGSTALTGGVDIIMELSRTGIYDRSNVRRLQCESRYSETPDVLQLRLENGQYVVEDMESLAIEPKLITLLQTMEQITLADMSFLLDTSETTARRVVTGMVQRGVVMRMGTGTAASPFRYSLNVPVD